MDHWASSCPFTGESSQPKANVLGKRARDSENGALSGATYIRVTVGQTPVAALLDTGCELSVLGSRLVPNLVFRPTTQKLYTASGSLLPLLGESEVTFQVGNQTFRKVMLVSDRVTEMILGIDWLEGESCQWDFGKKSWS